jgi:hypothetical protein
MSQESRNLPDWTLDEHRRRSDALNRLVKEAWEDSTTVAQAEGKFLASLAGAEPELQAFVEEAAQAGPFSLQDHVEAGQRRVLIIGADTGKDDDYHECLALFSTGGSFDRSGVLLSESLVVTAAHDLEANEFEIRTGNDAGNDRGLAEVVARDLPADVALLRLDGAITDIVPATVTLPGAPPATMVGYGGNQQPFHYGGHGHRRKVSNVAFVLNSAGLIQFEDGKVMVALGDSGGGCFAQYNGQRRLLGVAMKYQPPSTSTKISLYTRLDLLRSWISGIDSNVQFAP